jgi:ParB family chromosome partitioning protein
MPRSRYESMRVDQLEPAPWNPNELTPAEFVALVREVAGRGDTLKPVVVRANGNGRFMIVDGEHTWRAAVEAGFRDLPVELVEVDNFEARRETFVRNRHGRANPVRLGRMRAWMKDARGLTNSQLAHELSVSEGTVPNALLYPEAAHRFPEREDEIAQMGVRAVRKLLDDDVRTRGRPLRPRTRGSSG